MGTFVHSSFGTVVMTLFQGIFTAPSWHTFTYLACGWALPVTAIPLRPICGLLGRPPSSTFHASMSSSGAPSTTNAGNSGAPSSAWLRSGCPRARSFGSALMIPPRKKPAPRSRARPLPQWRGFSSARIPYAAGRELCPRHHADSAHKVAWLQPQRPSWFRTVSQTRASPQTPCPVSFPQSVGP